MNGERTDIQISSKRLGPSSEKLNDICYIYVRIFLEAGPATLDNIDYVIYKLHPSFKDPVRRSDERGTNFEIKIWTYGWFYISATIMTKQGLPIQIQGKVEFPPTANEISANGPEQFQW